MREAVIEKQSPLQILNRPAQRLEFRFMAGSLAQVHESERIPVPARQKVVPGLMRTGELGRPSGETGEDRMPADAAKPVLGVGEIGLAPMHDAMPVAAFDLVELLTDGVRLIEKIVV